MYKGSYAALITPFSVKDEIDWDVLKRLVLFHASNGTSGLVIAGTTGESTTLTMDENRTLIARALEFAESTSLTVVAGTGANNTAEAVHLTRNAATDGAEVCLSVVPYYNKPTQEGIYRHFMEIADCAEIDTILYNVPGRTIVDMSNDTVRRLESHPNIVGIKDATGSMDRLTDLRETVDPDFSLLSGDDATCCEYMLGGGHGVVSVTANIAPKPMADMCAKALAADADDARRINATLEAFHSVQSIETNPIPVKWAAWKLGLVPEGIRLPLTPLSDQFHGQVEDAFAQAGCTA